MLFAMFLASYAAGKPAPVPPGPAGVPLPVGIAAPNWRLLASNPVINPNQPPGLAGQFDLEPLQGTVGLLQSVLGNNVYSDVSIPKADMILDAVTVGYGTIAAIQLLPLANLPQLFAICTYAQSRAPLLQSIYDFPNGAVAGPIISPAQSCIETTEKVHLSFVLGQTVAMCMARQAWGVPRLFHKSLYGQFLGQLSPGMVALAPGLSPDFLCFAPLPGGIGVGLCFVESKGTHRQVNHDTRAKDRALINDAFEKQIAQAHNALLGGAYMCAVSLACRDEAQPDDRVVGQFWDPINEHAEAANAEAVHLITARYFMAVRAFLLSIGMPQTSRDTSRVKWDSQIMGMYIEMAEWQWKIMEQLAGGLVSEEMFFHRIEELDKSYRIHKNGGHNGDGLYLTMKE